MTIDADSGSRLVQYMYHYRAGDGRVIAKICSAFLAVAGAACLVPAAQAQSEFPAETARVAGIEASIDSVATEAGVLNFARELEAASDLSGAASALEAFLIANENSETVRAQYAVTLCHLDDIEAGKFEGAKLLAMKASAQSIEAVTAACGELPDLAKMALSEEPQ